MPDFIGGDPTSTSGECPAVFVSHETGDWLIRGKKITDPAVIDEMNQHIGLAEDEADIWLPARMTPIIREALDGYERGRQGPGQHTFAELLEATQTSAIRIEMRDTYDQTEQGYAEWKPPWLGQTLHALKSGPAATMTSGSRSFSGSVFGMPGRKMTVKPAAYRTSASARSIALIIVRSSRVVGC